MFPGPSQDGSLRGIVHASHPSIRHRDAVDVIDTTHLVKTVHYQLEALTGRLLKFGTPYAIKTSLIVSSPSREEAVPNLHTVCYSNRDLGTD